MRTFADNERLAWTVSVTAGSSKLVKSQLGFDPLAVADYSAIVKLADDPVLLVNVLYVLCRSQCEKRNITDEQFGRRLVGAIDNAGKALLEELIDNVPGRQRKILKRALAMTLKSRPTIS